MSVDARLGLPLHRLSVGRSEKATKAHCHLMFRRRPPLGCGYVTTHRADSKPGKS
jgi:hypothetical protein